MAIPDFDPIQFELANGHAVEHSLCKDKPTPDEKWGRAKMRK